MLPGPNIVNLALMIGDRFFGWRGAAAAIGGILLAPLVVVLLLARWPLQLARSSRWSPARCAAWAWWPPA